MSADKSAAKYSEMSAILCFFSTILDMETFLRPKKVPILIIHSASADVSAARYSEMSANLGFFGYIWPPYASL